MLGSISTYLYLAQGGFILATFISWWIGGYFFPSDIAMGFQTGPFYIRAIKSNYRNSLFTPVHLTKFVYFGIIFYTAKIPML